MKEKKVSYKEQQKCSDLDQFIKSDKDPIFQRMTWYGNNSVIFEIVKCLKHKELQMIGGGLSVRWLSCYTLSLYRSIKKYLKFDLRPCSVYMSLDYYRQIPLMSFNLSKRAEEYQEWAKDRPSHVMGSDFGLDLDMKNGTWKDAIKDAEAIRNLFGTYGVRYANWRSGEHGFHFIVPFEDMPDNVKALSPEKLIAFYKKFAEIIAIKVKSVDLSIYMPTRVLKCPYTIEKNGTVIFPLDDKSFKDLVSGKLQLDKPLDILGEYCLVNRGIYLQGKPEGIKNFIANWNGWENA